MSVIVAIIASFNIINLQIENPEEVSDDFCDKWINYLRKTCTIDDRSLNRNILVERLQEKFPVYCELYSKAINPKTDDKERSVILELLTMELFRNCTDKKKPKNFFKLCVSAWSVFEQSVGIYKIIKELEQSNV